MNKIIKNLSLALYASFFLMLSACAAEVGSEQWCAEMKETPSADWSANNATDFAKHCILK